MYSGSGYTRVVDILGLWMYSGSGYVYSGSGYTRVVDVLG